MLKQVFHTALNNLTEVDVVIIAIGIITLLLIFFLYGVKRSIGTKRKLDVKLLNSCLFFSGMYQWGIDVCPLLGTFGTVVSDKFRDEPRRITEQFFVCADFYVLGACSCCCMQICGKFISA